MFRLIPNMPFYAPEDGNTSNTGSGAEPLTASSLERMLEEDDEPEVEDLEIEAKPKKAVKKDSGEEDSSGDSEDDSEETGDSE